MEDGLEVQLGVLIVTGIGNRYTQIYVYTYIYTIHTQAFISVSVLIFRNHEFTSVPPILVHTVDFSFSTFYKPLCYIVRELASIILGLFTYLFNSFSDSTSCLQGPLLYENFQTENGHHLF